MKLEIPRTPDDRKVVQMEDPKVKGPGAQSEPQKVKVVPKWKSDLSGHLLRAGISAARQFFTKLDELLSEGTT